MKLSIAVLLSPLLLTSAFAVENKTQAPRPALSSDAKRLVEEIRFHCEKESALEGKTKKQMGEICRCIARNHEIRTSPEELKVIVGVYSRKLEITDPIDDGLSILLGSDADIAEACIARPSTLLKLDRK